MVNKAWENKYTVLIEKIQKELHYNHQQMITNFQHLFVEQNKENLRLIKKRARFRRYQLIGK